MTLTFDKRTIYRREWQTGAMRRAEVEVVEVPDTDAILELRDHPFTEGLMRIMHYPSTINGFIRGVRLYPGMSLYKDSDGNYGALFPHQ